MSYYKLMLSESVKFSRLNLIVGIAFFAVGLLLAVLGNGVLLSGLGVLAVAYALICFRVSAEYRRLAKRYQSRISGS